MAKPLDEAILSLAVQADPGIWFETETKIRGLTGRLEVPRMNVVQRRINAAFKGARRRKRAVRIIGLKPRKRGFSTFVAAIHYSELCKHRYEGVIVGNKLDTSQTVMRMMKVYSENDGLLQRNEWGSACKAGEEKIAWAHGSLCTQSTAMGSGSIRGQTPQFAHCTETSHWERQDETFLALMNAIPDTTDSCVFLESTPNGEGGCFWATWQQARWAEPDECPGGREYWRQWEALCPQPEDGSMAEFDFVRVFAAWFEFEEAATRLDDAQKDHIRRTLDQSSQYHGEKALIEAYGRTRADGSQVLGLEVEEFDVWEQLAWRRQIIKTKCGGDPKKFDQEYPRDPESCFLASGDAYFDSDAIAHYQTATAISPDHGQIDRPNKESRRVVWRDAQPDDAVFQRWEQPRVGCRYIISVDTSEGEDQTKGDDPDRHSVPVLRSAYIDNHGTHWPERMVARIKSPCRVPIHALVTLTHNLSLYYGNAMVIPEMNNSGLAFVVLAQERGMNLWKRIDINPKSGKEEERFGWRTTDSADYGGLRSTILEVLHKAIREKTIMLHCPNVVLELSKFVRNGKRLEAGTGAHDDDVLSIAIGHFNIDAASAMELEVIDRQLPRDLARMLGTEGGDGLAMKT